MKDKTTEKKKRVFVIEDEPDILELESIHLRKAGYEVDAFTEAAPMFAQLKKKIPDIFILDLMLPDQDGLDVCKTLKKNPRYAHIPVIMVTAKTEEFDVVLGLELGADDYIPKPFSPRELTARVKAVLRRGNIPAAPSTGKIEIADITIDPERFEVTVKNRRVNLTTTEFSILKHLAKKPGLVFSREKLLDLLWGNEKDVYDRTIDVHIKHLRDKLGSAGKLIVNIRGVGYKLNG
ncbi:MAG: response regulator transcription factor [bacterium]|nr:response regulator transcription factor [bacterium]